jgi:seryl-tRNA synthetase
VLELDSRHRAAQTVLQEMKARRNALDKEIGATKRGGHAAEDVVAAVGQLKEGMKQAEQEERARRRNRTSALRYPEPPRGGRS